MATTSSPSKVKTSLIVLDENMAEAFLARQVKNRPLSGPKVRELSDAIRDGEWEVNGESIKVDNRGRMIDGQHRCHAVITTGIAIETLLVEGVKPAVFDTLDTGKRRSISDCFGIDGEKSTQHLGSTIRALYIWEETGHGMYQRGPHTRKALSNHKAREVLKQNPDVRKHVAWGATLPGALRKVHVYLLRYLTEQEFGRRSRAFWETYKTGLGGGLGDPAYRLREKMMRHAAAKQGAAGRLTRREIYAYIVIAWNAYVAGASLKSLIWSEKSRKQGLPKINLDTSTWSEDR